MAGQPVCRPHKKCERAHKEARVNALSDNHWLRRQKARVGILPRVHLSRRHRRRRFMYGISLVKLYWATKVQGTLKFSRDKAPEVESHKLIEKFE